MAVLEIGSTAVAKLSFNEGVANCTPGTMAADTALDTKFGLTGQYYAKYKVTKDENVVFVFTTAANKTVKAIKGSGYAATEDATIIDAATGSFLTALESAKYAQEDGYIYFAADAAATAGVIEMA